jgi:hypothetical protein
MLVYGGSDSKVLRKEQLKNTGKSASHVHLVAHAKYVYELISCHLRLLAECKQTYLCGDDSGDGNIFISEMNGTKVTTVVVTETIIHLMLLK